MAGLTSRKWAALGAVAVVVLWVVGFFLAGKPPKFAATPADVVKYYATHHKQVLIAVVMVAIGIAIFLAVLAQMATLLRDAGQTALAATVLVGGAASAGLFSVGDGLYGVIAQAVAEPGADPGLARALYQLDQFAGIPMYWLSLLSILAVTVAARRGVFPGWAVWFGGVLAVLVALGGFTVKASGAFAAGTGPVSNLAFAAALVFLLEVGVLLWTAKEPAAQITA